MPLDVKEELMKMKVGIMRRMIRNQVHQQSLRKWKVAELKQEIVKMSKMDRIQLLEYKRLNDLQFFQSKYDPNAFK